VRLILKIIKILKKNNIKANKPRKGYSYFSVAISMVVIGTFAISIYKSAEVVVNKTQKVATNWQNQGNAQSSNVEEVDKCQGLVISSLSSDGYSYETINSRCVVTLLYDSISDSGGYTRYDLQFPKNTSAQLLIVAGGGGAGGAYDANRGTGGGGAGGLIYDPAYDINSGTTYEARVGKGGAGGVTGGRAGSGQQGVRGSNSIFSSYIVYGGGGGARTHNSDNSTSNGVSGGSGGGGGDLRGEGAGSSQNNNPAGYGFGNSGGHSRATYTNGGAGGGGGGAGGRGNDSGGHPTEVGLGGIGKEYDISGSVVEYARGGNGGNGWSGSAGSEDALPNTGNGGSGGGRSSNGGNGGSGIVIISFE
tara:strand:+ start:1311 stop:2396 length:1086 start_codon:yes stop_codon:yes gene_type:complete